MKLGSVPNFSLTPGVTCSEDACKTCYVDGCYARKAYRMYPAVRSAWDKNTDYAKNNTELIFGELCQYFSKYQPKLFRVHTAGDFVSVEYAKIWNEIAHLFPDCKFLAFTKRYDIVRQIEWADNFSIVFSSWTGVEFDRTGFPVAWMNDGKEDRIPSDALQCPGNCETCGMCFELKKIGKDVVFGKH